MKKFIMSTLFALWAAGSAMITPHTAIAAEPPPHVAGFDRNTGRNPGTEFCQLCLEAVGEFCPVDSLSRAQLNVLLGQCNAVLNLCVAQGFTPGSEEGFGCLVNIYKGLTVGTIAGCEVPSPPIP